METKIYRPIEATKQIRKLQGYIEEWNRSNPQLSRQIRAQHMKTVEMLIKIAIKRNAVFDRPAYLMDVDNGEGRVFKAGYFHDNGAGIAKCLNLLPKSLDNHLERLRLAGMAASFAVPENGKRIRRGGRRNETLFAINNIFFTD